MMMEVWFGILRVSTEEWVVQKQASQDFLQRQRKGKGKAGQVHGNIGVGLRQGTAYGSCF